LPIIYSDHQREFDKLLPVACLVYYFSTLKLDAVNPSETAVKFYQTLRRHISEDGILHVSCLENFISIAQNVRENGKKKRGKRLTPCTFSLLFIALLTPEIWLFKVRPNLYGLRIVQSEVN
jgi:hypothetical protein